MGAKFGYSYCHIAAAGIQQRYSPPKAEPCLVTGTAVAPSTTLSEIHHVAILHWACHLQDLVALPQESVKTFLQPLFRSKSILKVGLLPLMQNSALNCSCQCEEWARPSMSTATCPFTQQPMLTFAVSRLA